MECVSHKTEINKTLNHVRDLSFKEKKNTQIGEREINSFLDRILELKNGLAEKTEKLNKINEELEGLTWLDNGMDEECLKALNDLISSAKDLHSSLIRQYVLYNQKFKTKGIAKNEIKELKYAIDDLKDCYTDLESVYFFLPAMPDFVETTKELSLI